MELWPVVRTSWILPVSVTRRGSHQSDGGGSRLETCRGGVTIQGGSCFGALRRRALPFGVYIPSPGFGKLSDAAWLQAQCSTQRLRHGAVTLGSSNFTLGVWDLLGGAYVAWPHSLKTRMAEPLGLPPSASRNSLAWQAQTRS